MPVNILVAEDSKTMRRIIEMTFAGEDAKVTTVDSGEAAVAKAAEIRPDVVFADLSLSGMDGYAIAREIKSKPALAKTAVIVMASQKGPYDEVKGKAAGVDDHIVKPFDTQFVIDKVKQVLGKPRAAVGAAVAAPAAAAQAARAAVASKTTLAFAVPPAAAGAPPPAAGAPAAARPRPSAVAAAAPAAAVRKPAPAAERMSEEPRVAPGPASQPRAPAGAQAELDARLRAAGLRPEQIETVLEISREVIEKVAWEVVPDLAETIIREEIKRLTAE